ITNSRSTHTTRGIRNESICASGRSLVAFVNSLNTQAGKEGVLTPTFKGARRRCLCEHCGACSGGCLPVSVPAICSHRRPVVVRFPTIQMVCIPTSCVVPVLPSATQQPPQAHTGGGGGTDEVPSLGVIISSGYL